MARRYDSAEDAAREMARFRTEDRMSFILQPTKVLPTGVRSDGSPTDRLRGDARAVPSHRADRLLRRWPNRTASAA